MKWQLFAALCLVIVYAEAKCHHSDSHSHERHYHDKRGHDDSRERHRNWHRNEHANEISRVHTIKTISKPVGEVMDPMDPPDHTKLIPMARYVLHNADWASIATISVLPAIKGFPFSNVKSIADGPKDNSTGIPYFYMSPLDFTAKDLKKNSRATVLVSLEETRYCSKKNYDPEDPRCTRLMLSGKMKKVKPNATEYEFAKAALFERHPSMANFPPDHDWFIAKLKIGLIAMVDWFGGAKYIPVWQYLDYNYTESAIQKEFQRNTTKSDGIMTQGNSIYEFQRSTPKKEGIMTQDDSLNEFLNDFPRSSSKNEDKNTQEDSVYDKWTVANSEPTEATLLPLL